MCNNDIKSFLQTLNHHPLLEISQKSINGEGFNKSIFYRKISLEDYYDLIGKKVDLTFINNIDEKLLEQDLGVRILHGNITPHRSKNQHIKCRNIFVFDLDLKEMFPHYLTLKSREKIKFAKSFYDTQISNKIDYDLPIFYILFTGGGFHLAFTTHAKIIDFKTSETYKQLYTKLRLMLENHFDIKLDPACSNIGRIFRLPRSTNFKYEPAIQTDFCYFEPTADATDFIELALSELEKTKDVESSPQIKNRVGDISDLYAYERTLKPRPGNRSDVLTKLLREGLGLGLSEDRLKSYTLDFQEKFDDPNDSFSKDEALRVFKAQLEQHKISPFSSIKSRKIKDPATIASEFLSSNESTFSHLVYYQSNLYRFNNFFYEKIDPNELKAKIYNFLHSSNQKKYAKKTFVSDVMENLKNINFLKSSISTNNFLDSNIKNNVFFSNLANGILKLSINKGVLKASLHSHSPNFLSFYSLSFNFDQNIDAPIFNSTIRQIIPDPSELCVLQEFIGLCTINYPHFEKALIILGSGANGKGVIYAIIKALLGTENISNVPLENFTHGRTYALAETQNKLVNFASEFTSSKNTSLGLLKSFISGEEIQVEKKYIDPYTFKATARLIVTTNKLPQLNDPSNAIKRRLILLHLKTTIPEGERNPLLREPHFWIDSGELSGIFSWALEGLERLIRRGYFNLPQSLNTNLDHYQCLVDPTGSFIRDNIVEVPNGNLNPQEFYNRYRFYCEETGERPFPQRKVTQLIRDIFPHSTMDKNPRKVRGQVRRVRFIRGIEIKDFAIDTHRHTAFDSNIKSLEEFINNN